MHLSYTNSMPSEELPAWWFIPGSHRLTQYNNPPPSTETVRKILLDTSADIVAILLYPCLYDQWTRSWHEQSMYIREKIAQASKKIHTIINPPSGNGGIVLWDQVVALQNTYELRTLRTHIDKNPTIIVPDLTQAETIMKLRMQLHTFWRQIVQQLTQLSFF